MRVLVTGATGYLGRVLVPVLLSQGHSVRVLVRSSSGTHAFSGHDNVEVFEGDITMPESLIGIEQNIDRVFHLAVLGHTTGVTDESAFLKVNQAGTFNLLSRFRTSRVQRIVFTTTTAALGPIQGRVVTERDWTPAVTEYGRSKWAAEETAWQQTKQYSLPLVMVRLSHVYGPGEDRDLYRIIRMIRRGLLPQIGFSPNLYPAVYLDDAINGLVLAAEKGRIGETYIITDQDSHDLRKLRKIVRSELGLFWRPYPWIPKRPAMAAAAVLDHIGKFAGIRLPVSKKNLSFITASRRFSIEKAKTELGYAPNVSLKEGIRRTIAWYKKEGML